MFKSSLKLALRHIRKNKSFSFIHVSGLAIGMACCLLIMLWVQDEMRFDEFNTQIDNMFYLVHYSPAQSNSNSSSLPAPLVPHLKAKYPEIQGAARFRVSGRRLFSYEGTHLYEDSGGFIDPELFDIFSFKPLLSDPKTALKDLNTIVLSKSMAKRYFGSEDPLGKVLKLENQYDFVVGAVIDDIPEHSNIRFDYAVPFKNYGRFEQVNLEDWGRYEGYRGFVTLNPGVDREAFSKKIAREPERDSRRDERLKLHPFKRIRLSGLNNDGSSKSVLIFSIIAVLILLIACINFVNLSTAQAAKRAMEIGLRKVVGASKSLIRRQVYTELLVVVASAFVLAILLAIAFLPKLNALSGKTLGFSDMGNSGLPVIMAGIAMFVAIVSGTYPAFTLSSFSPVRAIKSRFQAGSARSPFRKSLVVAQFTVSIVLILSSWIIGRQMRYIKTKELGFEKDHLIYLELLGGLKTNFVTVKTELLRHSDIRGVTTAVSLPHDAGNNAGSLDWEGRPAEVLGAMNFISVEKDYFKTVGIPFVAGETFKTTPSNGVLGEFILNEKAVEFMKMKNPLGKSFKMWDRDPGRIVGVVKNVHNASLHEEIRPVFYVQFPYFYSYLIVNVNGERVPETIALVREVCGKINPGYPFEYHFMNEHIDRFYQTEIRVGGIISVFTVLAVFISCLGLFGLSLFMAEQRTKEIGIRKTLGAAVSDIVGLMLKDFLPLVAFSNLMAWPVAYFIMNKWLQNFAYRMNPGIWIFIGAGLAVMAVAVATVGYQSLKAASADPVRSLRFE